MEQGRNDFFFKLPSFAFGELDFSHGTSKNGQCGPLWLDSPLLSLGCTFPSSSVGLHRPGTQEAGLESPDHRAL